MDIKEIALKVADSLRNKIDGISHMQSNQGLVAFAEALIAEIAKQNEPVAYATTNEEDDLTMLFFDEDEARKYSGDDEPIKLYTIPPTAEQIANETAEACAKYIDSTNGNIRGVNTVFSKALRSGAWKDFKK